jgi:protein-disulfide isomerase
MQFVRTRLARVSTILICLVSAGPALLAATPEPLPKIDKAQVAAYLRYAEGWTDKVEAMVDDPKPSAFPGYAELDVHLTFQKQKLDRVYYVTMDGQRILNGTLYDLNQSPFKATLSRLYTNGAPSMGPASAPITIVVFSDFECPYCRDEAKILREGLPKKYPIEVRIVYKDFPLEAVHTWAKRAAIGGHCVIEQNPQAFWPYHDYMYEHQKEISNANLDSKILEFAKEQNLDALQLSSCVQNGATTKLVEDNQAQGRSLGVSQTPTLFINGRQVAGAVPLDQLESVIQMELNRKQPSGNGPTAKKDEKCCEVTLPLVGKH